MFLTSMCPIFKMYFCDIWTIFTLIALWPFHCCQPEHCVERCVFDLSPTQSVCVQPALVLFSDSRSCSVHKEGVVLEQQSVSEVFQGVLNKGHCRGDQWTMWSREGQRGWMYVHVHCTYMYRGCCCDGKVCQRCPE